MTRYLHKAGLIVAASIPIFILPARLSEGQWNDPVNLIGSEIVIFLMCLTCWYTIIFIQNRDKLQFISRLVLAVLVCCALSNLFYFIFNPYFKDFPFRTAQKHLYMSILMLSSRGVLMSVILIPAAYYIKKDSEARKARKENERLVLERIQIQNALLEQTVLERTRALQDTLSFFQKSQDELEHQFFIQSRLVASITHDVKTPFKYLVNASREIVRLSAEKEEETLHSYSDELHQSLESMNTYLTNLLEFTKLPLKEKVSKSEKVNLKQLIGEKSALFKGIIAANQNELTVAVDDDVNVNSNYNLLGIVLHNLLDNANNYTISGNIGLNVSSINGEVVLKISNAGMPIPQHIVEWMNSEYHWTDLSSLNRTNQEQGIGLVLVKEVSAILDLRIKVNSDFEGTVVELTF